MRKGVEKEMLHRKGMKVYWLVISATWSWNFDSIFANLAGGGDLAAGGSSRQPWVWEGAHFYILLDLWVDNRLHAAPIID